MAFSLAPASVALVSLAPLPFIAYGNRQLVKYSQREGEKGRRISEDAMAGTLDVIGNVQTVRGFATEGEEVTKFKRSALLQATLSERSDLVSKTFFYLFLLLLTSNFAVVTYCCAAKVASGEMRKADVAPFVVTVTIHLCCGVQRLIEMLPKVVNRVVANLSSVSKIEPNPNMPSTSPLHVHIKSQTQFRDVLAKLKTVKENITVMCDGQTKTSAWLEERESSRAAGTPKERVTSRGALRSQLNEIESADSKAAAGEQTIRTAYHVVALESLTAAEGDVVAGQRALSVIMPDGEPMFLSTKEELEGLGHMLPLELVFTRHRAPTVIKGDVEFKDVIFHYPMDTRKRVLDKLSFSITSGQKVGICGRHLASSPRLASPASPRRHFFLSLGTPPLPHARSPQSRIVLQPPTCC